MKKIFLALIATTMLFGCSMSSRVMSLIGANDSDTSAASVDPTATLIKDQFGPSYKYGKTLQPKFFLKDKVNVVVENKNVSIFVQKDAQLMRPVFSIKVMNNTSCDSKYQAHIKKLVTFGSSYQAKMSSVYAGSYAQFLASGINKTISATGITNTFLSTESPISISPTGASIDALTTITFNENNSKNLVCINSLIGTSKHGVTARTYLNEIPVFFVQLEMVE